MLQRASRKQADSLPCLTACFQALYKSERGVVYDVEIAPPVTMRFIDVSQHPGRRACCTMQMVIKIFFGGDLYEHRLSALLLAE
jgi:hypothetical protein